VKAVLQRVRRGRVSVDGDTIAVIERGLVILIGVGQADTTSEAEWLAEKCALYADTRKGRRPSFINAAPPEIAQPLVEHFVDHLGGLGVSVQKGVFGAHMLVEIENDGPVTILLERDPQS